MDERNEALLKRLDRLERANRRMKLIGFAIVAAVVGIGAGQGNAPSVFKAQRFQVVDDQGKVLADLGKFGSNQAASLRIYDHNGVLRTFTGVAGDTAFADDSGFDDFDSAGMLRTFSGSKGSGPLIGESGHFVFDKNGLGRTGATIDYLDNFVGTFTNDPSGKNRVALGTPESGSNVVFLNLNDVNQQLREQLVAGFDSSGGGEAEYLVDQNNVFRAGLQVDVNCCGDSLDEILFFDNANGTTVGTFYSAAGGGGTYSTFNSIGGLTGHLP